MQRLGVNILVLKRGAVGVMAHITAYIYIYTDIPWNSHEILVFSVGLQNFFRDDWVPAGPCQNQVCGFTWMPKCFTGAPITSTLKFGPKDVQRNRKLKRRCFVRFLHALFWAILISWSYDTMLVVLINFVLRAQGDYRNVTRITSRRVKTRCCFSGEMFLIVGLMIRHFQRRRFLICNLAWFS